MNQYGLPLAAVSRQTILPAMTRDGRVIGFYPIAAQDFTGAETSLVLSDGVVVPVSSVTVDRNQALRAVTQYMAALWETGTPWKMAPWASADLIEPGEGRYSWYSMPSSTWVTHFGKGIMIEAIQNNLDTNIASLSTPDLPPEASDGAQVWTASAAYASLTGSNAFFEFNWTTVFAAKNTTNRDALRIQVVSNPAPINGEPQAPMRATVVGSPILTKDGALYNTIRVTRLTDNLTPGAYTFTFNVVDTAGLSTPVTFTMTVL